MGAMKYMQLPSATMKTAQPSAPTEGEATSVPRMPAIKKHQSVQRSETPIVPSAFVERRRSILSSLVGSTLVTLLRVMTATQSVKKEQHSAPVLKKYAAQSSHS